MDFFLSLMEIILVNIVLSGDNAVVIALASRNLPDKQRWIAVFGGTFGAVALRILLTICAVMVLRFPYVQLIGGVLLIWIAVKLLIAEDENDKVHAHGDLWSAVTTIVIADVVMSLDNTLAIAAVAHNNMLLLCLGLAFSIPLIVFGSQLIMKIMDRHPIIVYIGAALIAWTAGEMISGERKIVAILPPVVDHIIPLSVMGLVVIGCWLYNRQMPRGTENTVPAKERENRKRR